MHKRRPRYSGRNPRGFHEKYKELNPDRYASEVEKVLAAGKTPAGMHRPIMVDETLACLRPGPGDFVVDCTLGGGGHAQALLGQVSPGGHLLGLDVDPIELPRTEERLRAAGFDAQVFSTRLSNFAGLPQALSAAGVSQADVVFADLGVSSMQLDNPDRGFSYKTAGPLDMRMNPTRGRPASELIARMDAPQLADMLRDNADEPHADVIASVLVRAAADAAASGISLTTDVVTTAIGDGLNAEFSGLDAADVAASVRRTFQALRIAVNDEFSALDALLRVLPDCLAPGGRVAILTFHSGEDRRVKKAFQSDHRDGIYASVADDVVRPSAAERRANSRASSAKLRWAVRAATQTSVAESDPQTDPH